jgi:phage-related minor tail protein
MNLIQRAQSPTPGFFKKLRNIGLILAAVSAAIISAPVALPATVVTIAGYAAVAGSVIGAVSQLTTEESNNKMNDAG